MEETNFWNYKEFNSVHVELSSKCNAACPGCQRFIMHSPIVKESLVISSVSFEQFKNWFPVQVVSKVKEWIFCGTYGDPMACKDVYQILEYVCLNGNGNIQLNTNGGLGSAELYRKIGELFFKYKKFARCYRYITFSIDGLEETNHIYRRNVIWKKVWENLMSYVETGAMTTWDYLHFKHNAHQVEEAKEIAQKYNINFQLKNPYGVEKKAMAVYNKDLELDYTIEHAIDNGYPVAPVAGPGHIPKPLQKIQTEGCITCYSKRNHEYNRLWSGRRLEIYIDSQGNVLPCCFVAQGLVEPYTNYGQQIEKIQKDMGTTNNLNHHSLKEIFDNGVLEVWSRSWAEKEIAACWMYCGQSVSKVDREIDKLYVKK